MASFNKILIVGYLGRDPEVRYTPQGTAVCNFTIATTEKRKGQGGETQDVTTWFRVTAWGRQAEIANQYLHKGKQVYVEGRLRQDEYTDKEGNRRQTLEVTATDLHFLGKADGSEGGGGYQGSRSDDRSYDDHQEPVGVGGGRGKDDDDIPF